MHAFLEMQSSLFILGAWPARSDAHPTHTLRLLPHLITSLSNHFRSDRGSELILRAIPPKCARGLPDDGAAASSTSERSKLARMVKTHEPVVASRKVGCLAGQPVSCRKVKGSWDTSL